MGSRRARCPSPGELEPVPGTARRVRRAPWDPRGPTATTGASRYRDRRTTPNRAGRGRRRSRSAAESGMIGRLAAGTASDPSAPSSHRRRDTSLDREPAFATPRRGRGQAPLHRHGERARARLPARRADPAPRPREPGAGARGRRRQPRGDEPRAILTRIAYERSPGVALSTVGFGASNHRDAMRERLADAGAGNYLSGYGVTALHGMVIHRLEVAPLVARVGAERPSRSRSRTPTAEGVLLAEVEGGSGRRLPASRALAEAALDPLRVPPTAIPREPPPCSRRRTPAGRSCVSRPAWERRRARCSFASSPELGHVLAGPVPARRRPRRWIEGTLGEATSRQAIRCRSCSREISPPFPHGPAPPPAHEVPRGPPHEAGALAAGRGTPRRAARSHRRRLERDDARRPGSPLVARELSPPPVQDPDAGQVARYLHLRDAVEVGPVVESLARRREAAPTRPHHHVEAVRCCLTGGSRGGAGEQGVGFLPRGGRGSFGT